MSVFYKGGFLPSGFGLFVAGEQLLQALFDTVYAYFYFVRIQQWSSDVL